MKVYADAMAKEGDAMRNAVNEAQVCRNGDSVRVCPILGKTTDSIEALLVFHKRA